MHKFIKFVEEEEYTWLKQWQTLWVGKCVTKENPKSDLDLGFVNKSDLDLGFVNKTF